MGRWFASRDHYLSHLLSAFSAVRSDGFFRRVNEFLLGGGAGVPSPEMVSEEARFEGGEAATQVRFRPTTVASRPCRALNAQRAPFSQFPSVR